MRVLLTGATGFIGGHVARKLRERGDEVVCLVRSPGRAGELRELGCELAEGVVSSREGVTRAAEGCDAAIHCAGSYKVGILRRDRPAMYEANVVGTERTLDGCVDAGVGRIVYVSTVAIFGDTGGQVVDEGYRRDLSGGFLSYYDETKYRAHEVALDRIEKGAPVVIVQPAAVYGPNDHSEIGNFIEQTRTGKLKVRFFPELGVSFVHVEDVAEGIVQALDRGEVGESYVLGGEIGRMGELIDKVAELSGRKPPRITMPNALVKLSAPFGPVAGPLTGFPPNLAEAIRASAGVTYWARQDKAERELGYSPRDLDSGLRDTLGSGQPAAARA